jgi:hypothetical protein
MRWVFLALATWGAVHPMAWFLTYMRQGNSLAQLIDAWFVNASTTGLVWDLTIAAIALTVWVLRDVVETGDRWRLAVIPATFCIGVSCGLPLYLFLILRPGARIGGKKPW